MLIVAEPHAWRKSILHWFQTSILWSTLALSRDFTPRPIQTWRCWEEETTICTAEHEDNDVLTYLPSQGLQENSVKWNWFKIEQLQNAVRDYHLAGSAENVPCCYHPQNKGEDKGDLSSTLVDEMTQHSKNSYKPSQKRHLLSFLYFNEKKLKSCDGEVYRERGHLFSRSAHLWDGMDPRLMDRSCNCIKRVLKQNQNQSLK